MADNNDTSNLIHKGATDHDKEKQRSSITYQQWENIVFWVSFILTLIIITPIASYIGKTNPIKTGGGRFLVSIVILIIFLIIYSITYKIASLFYNEQDIIDKANTDYNLAISYAENNEAEKAIPILTTLINDFPLNSKYLITRARTYFELKEYDLSEQDCLSIIEKFPNDIEEINTACAIICDCLFLCQRYEEALVQLNKYILLYPELAIAYYERSLCYLAIGNIQAAYDDINTALELGLFDIKEEGLRQKEYLETLLRQSSNGNTSNGNTSNKQPKRKAKNPKKVKLISCTKEDLLTLEGFNETKANKFIEDRNNGKMWYSIHAFASDFSLQPHEVILLQDRLAFPHKPNVKILYRC
jgi:tetratricopeptide (TPR) repeat protein